VHFLEGGTGGEGITLSLLKILFSLEHLSFQIWGKGETFNRDLESVLKGARGLMEGRYEEKKRGSAMRPAHLLFRGGDRH